MPRGPRKPLKQGRNGTRSINAQLQDLQKQIEELNPSGFTPGAAVPDSEATTVEGIVSAFNDLLASLRTAGVIAT